MTTQHVRTPQPATALGLSRRACLLALTSALAAPAWAQADDEGELFTKIRETGTLKVAVYKDNPPYSFEAGGQLQGLDVDVARALAAQMGLNASFLPFSAGEDMGADLRWMVERGHYLGFGPADMMMRVPVDRNLMFGNRKVLILTPYMSERPVLMYDSRRLSEPRTPEDLQSLPLAGEMGTGLTSAMLGYGGGLLREQVRILASASQAAQTVINGEAAATYITRSAAETAMNKSTLPTQHLRLVDFDMGHRASRGWPIGVAIKSANHELRKALEVAMASLQASGQMLEIFRKHRLTLTAP